MNTKTKILILVVFGILLIVFLFGSDNSTSDLSLEHAIPPSAITDGSLSEELPEYEKLTFPQNTLDTSEWETYENEEFGFTVKYPKEWEVEDNTESHSRLVLWPVSRQGPDDRGTYVFISDKTIEGFIQDADTNPKDLKFASRFSHNGMTGVIIETKLGVWNENYPFPDEREVIKQYTFDTGNHRLTFYNPSLDDSFNAVLEQILLSFTLTE